MKIVCRPIVLPKTLGLLAVFTSRDEVFAVVLFSLKRHLVQKHWWEMVGKVVKKQELNVSLICFGALIFYSNRLPYLCIASLVSRVILPCLLHKSALFTA